MEQNKGLGGSLVEVFDAALNLVKTEARVQMARATDIIKAKGIGAVLLLASTGPLVLGLIFLILFFFYGLMRLGLGAWAAALFIAIASFGLAGMMAIAGINKLKETVADSHDHDDYDLSVPYTAHADDLRYGKVTGSQVVGSEYIDTDASGLDDARVKDLRVDIHGDPVHTERRSDIWASTHQTPERPLGRHSEARHGEHEGSLTHGKPSDAPGIAVSTAPTYQEDMKKEGY